MRKALAAAGGATQVGDTPRGVPGTRKGSHLSVAPAPSKMSRNDRHDPAHASASAAWQLIRDDAFDRASTDEELEDILARFTGESATPFAEVLRSMVGLELAESDAKTLFGRVLEHRRSLSQALGRAVHVRVAALDLLTLKPHTAKRRDSQPILVTPSLLERALEEATQDEITGLPQRAHFMSLLRHELKQRTRREVTIVFIDLDGMKRVNDTYGHAQGDEILRTLATCGRKMLRHGDVLARIGGDEFALLLVGVGQAEAEAAAARLRTCFEAKTKALRTSFSAGVASADPDESADDLLLRADAAMYREKRERSRS